MNTGQITITTDRKDFDFDVAYKVTESEPRTFDHPGCQRNVEIYFIEYNGSKVEWLLSDEVINEIECKILET